jgi:hypothetical protein
MPQEIWQCGLASYRRQRCAGIITDSAGGVAQFPGPASASLLLPHRWWQSRHGGFMSTRPSTTLADF